MDLLTGNDVAPRLGPARKRRAPWIGLALVGWLCAIGGVLLFGLHPGLAVAAMLVAMSPTLFRSAQ